MATPILFETPGWSLSPSALASSTSATKPTSSKQHQEAKKKRKREEDVAAAAASAKGNKRKSFGGEHGGRGGDWNSVNGKGKEREKRTALGSGIGVKAGDNKKKGKGDGSKEGARAVGSSPAPRQEGGGYAKKREDKKAGPRQSTPPKARLGKGKIPEPATKPGKAEIQAIKPTNAVKSSNSLQQKLKEKLSGGRFRWINEKLYTATGDEAFEMMEEDPSMFLEYHSGFSQSSTTWPSHPLHHIVTSIPTSFPSPSSTLIVDLGCGDATLAKTLSPKGYKVISFDLVSTLDQDGWVVKAQCSKRFGIALPGADNEEGDEAMGTRIVDCVVCCLSLMSKDWVGIVREARRILKTGGLMKIAEVTSRFSDVKQFISLIRSVGFSLESKDESNTHFVLFTFRKIAKATHAPKSDDAWDELVGTGAEILKPCVYKKR